MALIKCPECGHEISSFAESCISCGYPLKKDSNSNNDSRTILSLFEKFALTSQPLANHLDEIYSVVKEEATSIRFEKDEHTANDIIAKEIIEGLSKSRRTVVG